MKKHNTNRIIMLNTENHNSNNKFTLLGKGGEVVTVNERFLSDKHREDWRVSSDAFVSANVATITGEQAVEHIAGAELEQREQDTQGAASSRLFRFNKKYSCIYSGDAWLTTGVDPLANYELMAWGAIKPDHPRTLETKKTLEDGSVKISKKALKYDAPAKVAKRVFVPKITRDVAQVVFDRYNLENVSNPLSSRSFNIMAKKLDAGDYGAFWQWFKKNKSIPFAITEGDKKAGAMCSRGIPCVSAQGMWDFCEAQPKNRAENAPKLAMPLKGEIALFMQKNRPVFILIDEDTKEATRKLGDMARNKAAFQISLSGADPLYVRWNPKNGKGIDDYIEKNGDIALFELLATATSVKNEMMESDISNTLKRDADIALKQTLLNIDLTKFEGKKLVAIKAPKGTGKTQKILAPLAQRADKVLTIGHLINLTKANADRMGCTYRTEVDQGLGRAFDQQEKEVTKVATVINSLLAFNVSQYKGYTIIIDEVVQMVRALLTSGTIREKGIRVALQTRLKALMQNAKQIIVADADLNDEVISYLENLLDNEYEAFLVVNDLVQRGFNFTSYEAQNYYGIAEAALKDFKHEYESGKDGEHVVIACDSKSKVEVIAEKARQYFPSENVFEIHSDSSGDPLNQAFATNPDEVLSYFQGDKPCLIIYSPSLGTGTSIESDRISRVYGIFSGASISDTDILQMLGRVRCNADRHIWINESGRAYSRISRSGSPTRLKQALKNSTKMIAYSIRESLSEDRFDSIKAFDWDNDAHIEMYCQLEAAKNRAMPRLRDRVLARLENEGNNLIDTIYDESNAMRVALETLRLKIDTTNAEETAISDILTPEKAKELAERRTLERFERQQLSRHYFEQFYCVTATPELVLKDKHGARRRLLRSLEELIYPETAKDRTVQTIEGQALWGMGWCPQDFKKSKPAQIIRDGLGLMEWIHRTDAWTKDDAKLIAFKKNCVKNRDSIKLILGFLPSHKMSAQQMLTKCLAQLDVSLIKNRKRIDGKPVWLYQIDQNELDESLAIIEARREAIAQVERDKEERRQAAYKDRLNAYTQATEDEESEDQQTTFFDESRDQIMISQAAILY